jgi:hypothetical protein
MFEGHLKLSKYIVRIEFELKDYFKKLIVISSKAFEQILVVSLQPYSYLLYDSKAFIDFHLQNTDDSLSEIR